MDIVNVLTQLGFTEYEAKAYITLLQHPPLNGYELARESKLPRANVYSVLEKLENRGVVVRMESQSGTRYAPIPPKELIQRLTDQMQSYLSDAESLLGFQQQPMNYEYIWNIQGYQAMIEHARYLVDGADNSLMIALSPSESLVLKDNLENIAGRGVAITTLCLEACQEECGRCKGHVLRYKVRSDELRRWLIVIPDGVELLAGEIGVGNDAQSVRTRQHLLVDLTASYIRRSIALAVLLEDLKSQPADVLSLKTQTILNVIDPTQAQGNWLEHLSRLIRKDPHQPQGVGLSSGIS